MRIYRHRQDSNFTIIPNETLQDERLSIGALGILCQLISRPDGWNTTADDLWKHLKKRQGTKTGQGREAVRAAFAELECYGYLVRRKVRDDAGHWATVLELHSTAGHHEDETQISAWDMAEEAPGGGATSQHDSGDRGTETQTSDTRASANRASETLASSQRTDEQRTDRQSTEEEDAPALADARAAAAAARDKQLQRLYTVVNNFSDQALRDCLLKFERHRPRIYRECRQRALAQLEQADMRILNREQAAREVDNLSLKYGILHYEPTKNWPGWMVKPLEAQYAQDQKSRAS